MASGGPNLLGLSPGAVSTDFVSYMIVVQNRPLLISALEIEGTNSLSLLLCSGRYSHE